MVKKKTNSRIPQKKPGRLKIGARVSLFNIHHLCIFTFLLQTVFKCMIYSVCIFHDRRNHELLPLHAIFCGSGLSHPAIAVMHVRKELIPGNGVAML